MSMFFNRTQCIRLGVKLPFLNKAVQINDDKYTLGFSIYLMGAPGFTSFNIFTKAEELLYRIEAGFCFKDCQISFQLPGTDTRKLSSQINFRSLNLFPFKHK